MAVARWPSGHRACGLQIVWPTRTNALQLSLLPGREVGHSFWVRVQHDLTFGTDHELIRVVRDDAVGLLAVIAVHSTALGPAMGGVRRREYAWLDEAVTDALRLSAAMTLKASAAGLPLGGGKSVILDGAGEPSRALLQSFADAIEELGGRYAAAEDIGTTSAHMDEIARRTRWVAGQSPAHGGNGDPSPATALTVFEAMLAAAGARFGLGDLRGKTVGIVGVGKVGRRLAELVTEAGASVVLADADTRRATAVASALPRSRRVDPAELLGLRLDILAPCATGGLITSSTARGLDVEIICGAANNMLASDSVADALAAQGILYVPDFLANAGGIVHVGGAFIGWEKVRIADQMTDCIGRVADVLAEAQQRAETPLAIALERAGERLADTATGSGLPTSRDQASCAIRGLGHRADVFQSKRQRVRRGYT